MECDGVGIIGKDGKYYAAFTGGVVSPKIDIQNDSHIHKLKNILGVLKQYKKKTHKGKKEKQNVTRIRRAVQKIY